MVSPDAAERPRASLDRALPLASVTCALVDAVLALVMTRGESLRVRVEHFAYVAGHRLLIGAILAAFFGFYFRAMPSRFRARPNSGIVATAIVSTLFLGGLIYPSFGRQGWLFAGANLLSTWFAFVALAVFVRIEHVWKRLRLLPPMAFVVVCAHHFVFRASVPELHFALTIYEICLAAIALRGAAPLLLNRPRVHLAAQLALGALGIASAALRPPFVVAANLAKDTGSVFRFLTPLYRAPQPNRDDIAMVSDARWFTRREAEPAMDPSGPRILVARPIVVLFTIDALRYEVFADKRATLMPNLDALTKEATVFTHAYSTATATAPSLSSIVSGHFYSQSRWEFGAYPGRNLFFPNATAKEGPTIATRLADAHVPTFWAPPMGRLDQSWGIVHGFAEEVPAANGQERSGKELGRDVLAFLARHRNGSAFAFTHILEAHSPYTSPGKTPYERYLGDVTAADAALGEFITGLRQQGLWNRTILIVSADHGEAFGEHDQVTHGGFVYDIEVHVPLVIRVPPGMGGPPRVVDTPASLIDIPSTVLELFGVPVPGDFQGQSLVPWLRGENPDRSAPIAFDTPADGISPGRKSRGLLFRDGLKAMWSKPDWRFELYDLARDPEELHNLADENPKALTRLAVLIDFFSTHELR